MRIQTLQRNSLIALLILATLSLVACGGEDARTSNSTTGSSLPDTLFLSEAPDGVQSIASLKASAKEGDEVTVRAIIGGGMDPIVSGRASAMMMDASVNNPCTSEDDHCTTPWDYCCTPQEVITENIATLQVLDDAGKVLKADLGTRIQPMTTLIVKGIVGPRPDDKVLAINALAIYIEDEGK